MQKFSETLNLIEDKKLHHILLAISGGMDSVVLFDLLLKWGVQFSAAHANFHLRGKESDEDEAFVRKLAERKGIKLYVKNFDTRKFASEKNISLEMAARELRYTWFDELIKNKGFSCVMTAHHQDDQVETIIYNLVKGSSIRGLRGMKLVNDDIVRPLINISKDEIIGYAKENELEFVTDKTNADTTFQRNFIRHKIIPLLKQINPSLGSTLGKNALLFSHIEEIVKGQLEVFKEDVVFEKKNTIEVDLNRLKSFTGGNYLLYEYLKVKKLSLQNFDNILEIIDAQTGAKLETSDALYLKNRNLLVINSLKRVEMEPVYIHKGQREVTYGDYYFTFEFISGNEIQISKKPNEAYLNASKISYPIMIRPWNSGDSFTPFGMTGRKKLSDYFIDKKISVSKKMSIPVIEMGGEIVWITGFTIDDRFKIDDNCKEIFKIVVSITQH